MPLLDLRIVLSIFDIDRGKVVLCQYPPASESGRISSGGGDNYSSSITDYLAEQMLPDGAHLVEEDWTVFFLNRHSGMSEGVLHYIVSPTAVREPEQDLTQSKNTTNSADPVDDWTTSAQADLPGRDVITLAVNSTKPQEGFHPELNSGNASVVYRCLNYVQTIKNAAIRRGAQCMALACCTPLTDPYLVAWQPLLKATLALCFEGTLDNQTELITQLYHGIQKIYVQLRQPYPSYVQRLVWRCCLLQRTHESVSISKDLFPKILGSSSSSSYSPPLSLSYPVDLFFDDFGLPTVSVVQLVKLFRESVMLIVNAIMLNFRVLFLGRRKSPGQVIAAVLASVCLVCPPLVGILPARCYPHVSLVDISWTQVSGYIAGICNPIVETKADWWDLLCDLDTGKVMTSAPLQSPTGSSGSGSLIAITSAASVLAHPAYLSEDKAFLQQVLSCLDRFETLGEEPSVLECRIRNYFRGYLAPLLLMADPHHVFPDYLKSVSPATTTLSPRTASSTNSSMERVSRWCAVPTFEARTLEWFTFVNQPMYHSIATVLTSLFPAGLSSGNNPTTSSTAEEGTLLDDDYVRLLLDLRSLLQAAATPPTSSEAVHLLLCYLTLPKASLHRLASLLLHASAPVRAAAVAVLQAVEQVGEGKRALDQLNSYLTITYDRLKREVEVERGKVRTSEQETNSIVHNLT